MTMRFEDLDVWKRAARLSADIYKALRDLTDYGFKDQITRSSLSIPSNIAEGFERLSQKECLIFLSYAKGSCAELRTQILIGIEIGYIYQAGYRKGLGQGNKGNILHACRAHKDIEKVREETVISILLSN